MASRHGFAYYIRNNKITALAEKDVVAKGGCGRVKGKIFRCVAWSNGLKINSFFVFF
jgi:hypothetical protein